jgi:hypothetical protein
VTTSSLALGTALAALPALLALAWAIQRRLAGRYLACLAAGLVGAAGLAAALAMIGSHLTHDPDASGALGNWSGLAGALLGLAFGWVAGAVSAPAALLRALDVRLAAARVAVAILSGVAVSGVLVYALHVFHVGDGPLTWPMRILGALSSVSTFAALVLASRERPAAPAAERGAGA